MINAPRTSFSKTKTTILFSLVLILALLIFLPAKLALWAFPIAGLDTRNALIKGMWWNGSIAYGKLQNMVVDEMRWHWWPAPLSGQFSNWQIAWQDNLTQGEGEIAWPLVGAPLVNATDLHIGVDIAYLPIQQARQFGVLAIYGKVSVQAADLTLSLPSEPLQTPKQILQAITLVKPVKLQTTDIYIESTLNNYLVYEKVLSQGTAEVVPGDQPNSLAMNFTFPTEPLSIKGALELQAEKLSWRANISPDSKSPAWISNLLPLFASVDGNNGYILKGQLGL